MPKFCPLCGANHPDNAKFCQQCGAPFEGPSIKEDVMQTTPTATGPAAIPSISTLGAKSHKTLRVGDPLRRILAFILDSIFLWLITMVLDLIPFLNFNYYEILETPPFIVITSYPLYVASIVYDFMVSFLYFGLLETYNKGQTLGKAILSMRSVLETNGEPVQAKQAFLNAITKSHLILLLIDLFFGFVSQQKPNLKQIRLVQRLTGEVVVRIDNPVMAVN